MIRCCSSINILLSLESKSIFDSVIIDVQKSISFCFYCDVLIKFLKIETGILLIGPVDSGIAVIPCSM